jgi:hypothetical protein
VIGANTNQPGRCPRSQSVDAGQGKTTPHKCNNSLRTKARQSACFEVLGANNNQPGKHPFLPDQEVFANG